MFELAIYRCEIKQDSEGSRKISVYGTSALGRISRCLKKLSTWAKKRGSSENNGQN